MAKRGSRNNVVEDIEVLIEGIMTDANLNSDAIKRIASRADNVKKLVRNGSERNWNTEDPREVTQLVAIVLEEFIYANLDAEDHKDLAASLVKIVEDEDYEETDKRSKKGKSFRDKYLNKNKKNSKVDLDSTTEKYFSNFYDFLSTNKITTRPSFATFVKCIEKFNLRKQCVEPPISTQELFNKWDAWVVNR